MVPDSQSLRKGEDAHPATKRVVMRRRGSERGVSPLPLSDIATVTGESYGHSEDLEGSPLLLQRDVGEC